MSIENKMKEWFDKENKRYMISRGHSVPLEAVLNKLIQLIDNEFEKIDKFLKEKFPKEGGEKE